MPSEGGRAITAQGSSEDLRAELRAGIHIAADTDADAEPGTLSAEAAGLGWLCRELVLALNLWGTTVTLMVPDGQQGVAAASEDAIRSIDALQFDLGEGPNRDAFVSGQPVLLFDLTRAGGRWPGFTSAAVAAGVGAVYAFPLQLGAVRFGVLTGYSDMQRALEHRELLTYTVYAEVATEFLIAATSGQALSGGSETFLAQDVQVRREVYQAQGMVMVDLAVGLGEALARLRALAFADGVDLNELAADIVAGRRRLTRDAS